ncbi:MAG: glycoside hydrolase family 127 protein [Christensenellales bacterium]|jgi:DUF1680 family protein
MSFAMLKPVPFHQIEISDNFWSSRLTTLRKETIRYCIRRCEETGRIANFRRAGKLEEGGFQGIYFNDSDVYKVLEGAAYVLHNQRDEELERITNGIIEAICAAQQEDGYLFSYYILTGLDQRWKDMGYHEAYCLGHMLEGAIAYYQATGKRRWLDTAVRALEQMMTVIGPGKKNWVVGHQELELALMRLYRFTSETRYLDFASWLVAQRGHGHLDAPSFVQQNLHEEYCQDDVPAEKLIRVTGHAVRAMYYFSGIADIVSVTGNTALGAALDRLWNNVIPANYYLTGGIGQSASNEGFTRDWHLPNLTAYCETCAAIGMALWNQRMNLLYGDAKYADIVETEIYNGALAGISLDGLSFFYDNPLASDGRHQRSKWFSCSCCPTNLARFLPSVGGYLYASGESHLYVNQYVASKAQVEHAGHMLQLRMETGYPWSGKISLSLDEGDSVSLKLRKPGWCKKYSLHVDGQAVPAQEEMGYLGLELRSGQTAVLDLDMPPRRVYSDRRVRENLGRVAFARGPLVYCAEEVDQQAFIPAEYFHADLAVSKTAEPVMEQFNDELGGIYGMRVGDVRLIPYYAWSNRSRGAMAVWLKESNVPNSAWPYWFFHEEQGTNR